MKHFLINVTWRCQFKCSYCWVEHSVREREAQFVTDERTCEEWANAIRRDNVELVDIAGGEPFFKPWIGELIDACPRTTFGLSTNGHCVEAIRKFAAVPRRNVCSVNISLHPEEIVSRGKAYLDRFAESINLLRIGGYRVASSVVCAGDNASIATSAVAKLADVGIHVSMSPFEDVSDLGTLTDTDLECDGGISHISVAPDGKAWPCLTTMRSPYWAETCLGNWVDGVLDLSRKPVPCRLKCADFYILPSQHEAGDMWLVRARKVER